MLPQPPSAGGSRNTPSSVTAPLSLYLDLVRFLAALTVLLAHLSGQRLTGGLFWQVSAHGESAVTVFFVLSGFVIAFVTTTRERDWRGYAASRAARIYSVALPAVLLTMAIDRIGFAARPALYEAVAYDPSGQIGNAVLSLLFVNQLWFVNIVPGTDLPYWSLGFEVWYYAVFAAACFAPGPWRIALPALLLFIAGPRIALMAPLWLFGLAAWHLCRRNPLTPRAGLALALAMLAAMALSEFHLRPHLDLALPWGLPHHMPAEMLLALCFAAQIVGLHAATPLLPAAPASIDRAIRWLAGATFSIYLLHLPLAQFLAALSPFPTASWANRALVLAGTLIGIFLIAAVTERRKDAWRRVMRPLFGLGVARPSPARAG